jgi:hypothetical protein
MPALTVLIVSSEVSLLNGCAPILARLQFYSEFVRVGFAKLQIPPPIPKNASLAGTDMGLSEKEIIVF